MTNFSAAGYGGVGRRCNDVSVSVICDTIKAASFRFQLFVYLIDFTFLHTKQPSVSSAGVEKCMQVGITVQYLYYGGTDKLASNGISICVQM